MKKVFLTLLSVAVLGTGTVLADSQKLDFDGTGDLYGLTRVRVEADPTPSNMGSLIKEWSYKAGDVEFKVTLGPQSGSDAGFALVDGYGKNRNNQSTYGFAISGGYSAPQKAEPEINISVPGAKINSVTIELSGSAWSTASDLFVNDGKTGADGKPVITTINPESGTAAWATAIWTGEAENSVTVSYAPRWYMTYIHSINVDYTLDSGDKLPNGLAFSQTSVDGILKVGGVFNAPELSNPHNLPLEWESSNQDVATVDQNGAVTLLTAGKTRITARTAGNDQYAPGNVSYDITVLRSANNIKDLFSFAPNKGDRVYVNFPMIVTCYIGTSGNEYVVDMYGNAALVRGEKLVADEEGENEDLEVKPMSYDRGSVIPQGWIVTNTPMGNSTWTQWTGFPEKSSSTTDVVYPRVDKVTPEDAYRVVVLKNLSVTASQPAGIDTPYYGKAGDDTYEIRNSFGTCVPEGTWDVTCVVSYAIRSNVPYFYLMPLKAAAPAKLEFPASFNVTADSKHVEINQYMDEEEERYTFEVTGTTYSDKVVMKFDLPSGWDGLVGYNSGIMGASERRKKANSSEWLSIDNVKAMLEGETVQEGTSLVFDADKATFGTYFLYSGDKVDVANPILINCYVTQVEPEDVAEFEVTVNGSATGSDNGIKIVQDNEDRYEINITGETTEDNVVITIGVPEGWDGFIGMYFRASYGAPASKKALAPVELMPIDPMMESMMTKGNVITIPADGALYTGMYYLYKGNEYDEANPIMLNVQVAKGEPSGVSSAEAIDQEARYFNLRGEEVTKPAAGLYIKLLDGKVTKVILK